MGLLNAILTIIDVFENTRRTDTDVPKSKPNERNYNADFGLTGDPKIDCPRYKPSKKKEKVSKEKEER